MQWWADHLDSIMAEKEITMWEGGNIY